jgi:myo-inositol-1(or 4)-monophosphatase
VKLLIDIAITIRSAVLPLLGRPRGRGAEGVAIGGDTTFGIDVIAEEAGGRLLEQAADQAALAWYTEDRGLVVRGAAQRVIVLDPIDGTRPAGAGLEAAVVSIAAAPYSPDVTLGDVDEAVVLELRTGNLFTARRGRGIRIVAGGETRGASPSGKTSLEGSFWVYGLRGRPAMPSAIVLSELIDATGVSGGTFDLGSAAYSMTRVVNGQMDAYVDHGQRLIDDIPSTQALFEAVADGAVLNNSPYDVAAALLICQEAGCPVTDARGLPLDERPLLGSGPDVQVSTLAAATPELHAAFLEGLDRGMTRLRASIG